LGCSQRVLRDYKPDEPVRPKPGRRITWFAAGLGIPLLGVALMTPEKPAGTGAAIQPPEASAPAFTEQANAPDPTAAGISAAAEPAADIISIDAGEPAPAGEEMVLEIRRGDSLDRLFRRNGLSAADLAELTRADPAHRHLRLVRPGDVLRIRHDGDHVLSLTREIGLTESLVVERREDGFEARIVEHPLEARAVRATGVIDSSLFLAAAEAGISDRTIMNLAGIFAWDIDFVLDIRKGDEFTVIFEELWRDGERLTQGDILAAEFVNQGERFRALRFEDETGRADYFTPEGRSVRKAFLRAPLSFSRISSNFNPRRRHPKLNTIRAHKGVDYAAPRGTPVKAAGDGKVVFRGRKGGYGNTIILQHGGNITTLYAHLSRFAKARIGTRVRQGDAIGYVGATGLATGPHLHYEYRRNGVHLNPRTVKLPDAEPLDPRYRAAFDAIATPLLRQLDERRELYAADAQPSTS